MLRLHEYQAKLLFSRFGILTPKGRVTSLVSDVYDIAESYGGQVVVKSQVLVTGRGKAGGIRLAKSAKEAENLAGTVLSMVIKGQPVHKVLVEQLIKFEAEYFMALIIDPSFQMPMLVLSSSGGADVENVLQIAPNKVARVKIDPLLGLMAYQVRSLALAVDIPRHLWRQVITVALRLWQLFEQCDAILVEVNPLVVTPDAKLIVLDGKIMLDDHALYRHPELAEMRSFDAEEPLEIEARKHDLSYIKMDGDIGCMVNGAGLAMATMDLLKLSGGKPANFMDIGGGASAEKIALALCLLLEDQSVRSVLINIFGGITRCDDAAMGIRQALENCSADIPIVVRLDGLGAEEGWKILDGLPLIHTQTLSEASQKVIEITRNLT